jgi:hypothetical protein
MFLGVGIPWALALLPREVWRERVTVLAVGMALGPVGLTAVMFALGTAGRITLGGTLIGSAALAAVGAGIAWRRVPYPLAPSLRVERGNGQADRAGLLLRMRGDAGASKAVRKKVFRGETLLIAGIGLLVLLNVIVVAYWPFIAYDVQWVYGYNARIFILQGRIPSSMGYYPQLVPLGYTYMQQAWGALGHSPINDHAARVIVPWFNTAMILMAYVLGWRVFGRRRVGLLTAAAWTFYPHVAAWSGAGDLEIPVTLYMTGAAVFFIDAWRTEQARYAVVSGLLLGGALWTKPTAGALAFGVMLAVAGQAAIARLRWAAWRPKLRIALITGAASVPIGGMWYLHNVLLGHTAVVFPASYWHSFAQRSGQEFGWPLLIAALVAGGLVITAHHRGAGAHRLDLIHSGPGNVPTANPYLPGPLSPAKLEKGGATSLREKPPSPFRGERETQGVRFDGQSRTREEQENGFIRNFLGSRWLLPVLALVLLLVGTLPTALNPARITQGDNLWQWVRGDLTAGGRLGPLDWLLIAAGFGLLAWLGREVWRAWPRARRETVLLLWALLLPYGVVWFLDFSYHYRLSFAIVPLAAVQVAALIDGWLWDWLAARQVGRAAGSALAVGVIAVAATAGVQHSALAWLHGGLPDDTAKYDRGNPALMVVVHMLEQQAEALGRPPVVAIPGEDRLPFFFPTWDIRNSRDADKLPTRLEDLAGVDIFVNNGPGIFLMKLAGLWPNSLQADADVGIAYNWKNVTGWNGNRWPTVLQPIPLNPDGSYTVDDGDFHYTAFSVHPEARYMPMKPAALRTDSVVIGRFAQFIGHDIVSLNWHRGDKIVLTLYWRPTDQAPPPQDYSIYIHLLDAQGTKIANWDGEPLLNQYPTRFWRPGESLLDYWEFRIPKDVPTGPASLRIGIYDAVSGERLPVTIDGQPAGDGVTIETRIVVK